MPQIVLQGTVTSCNSTVSIYNNDKKEEKMKKILMILMILAIVSSAHAQIRMRRNRPLVELAPTSRLYISSVRFGIGADIIVNPLRNFGVRFGLTEISFGEEETYFTLNQGLLWVHGGSLDALFYLPTRGMRPYVHAGFGLTANGATTFVLRGGVGFDYRWDRGVDLFLEPGILIIDPGYADTDFVFRLAAGVKFGIVR
jgi:hypothetical protein